MCVWGGGYIDPFVRKEKRKSEGEERYRGLDIENDLRALIAGWRGAGL